MTLIDVETRLFLLGWRNVVFYWSAHCIWDSGRLVIDKGVIVGCVASASLHRSGVTIHKKPQYKQWTECVHRCLPPSINRSQCPERFHSSQKASQRLLLAWVLFLIFFNFLFKDSMESFKVVDTSIQSFWASHLSLVMSTKYQTDYLAFSNVCTNIKL